MDTTLKPKEKKLLKRINKSKITVTRIDENLANLIRFGFVSYHSYQFEKNGKAEFSITDKGERYLLELNFFEHSHKFKEIRAWITLAIAILSFLLSVFSILNQYYKWIDAQTDNIETTSESIAAANTNQSGGSFI